MNEQSKRFQTQRHQHWGKEVECPLCSLEATIVYGQGETILLADNNDTLLKLGEALLKKLHYNVLTARSADEMMCRCQSGSIDLIVVDTSLLKKISSATLATLQKLQPTAGILHCSVFDISFDKTCHHDIVKEHILLKPYTVSSFSQAIGRKILTSKMRTG